MKYKTNSEDSKKKAAFRRTAIWEHFRERMCNRQNGRDFVTNKPLHKGWNLHHCCMKVEEYEVIEYDRFYCLNSQSHDVIHFLYNYYKKDPLILERVKIILDRMVELNNE